MAERTDLKENNENNEDRTDDTEVIREKIEETRLEMGETINAIEERLSLENISEQVSEKVSEKASEIYESAKDTVYDATINKAGNFMKKAGRELEKSGVVRTVMENPFPLALIALGAGMLYFGGRQDSYRTSDYYAERQRSLTSGGDNKSTIKKAGSKIGSVAGAAYETAANTADSVTDAVSDTAGNAAQKFEDLTQQARRQYDYYIDENPLAVGAVALAAGAIIGLAIPSTDYEDKLMGETRENMVSAAKDKVSVTAEKVKTVAENTVGEIGKEAVNNAKKVADKAIDTVGDQVRKEGLVEKRSS